MSVIDLFNNSKLNAKSKCSEMLELYNNIDIAIDKYLPQKQDVKCKKGCSKCCSNYFGISGCEMLLILEYISLYCPDKAYQYIEKGKSNNKLFSKKYPLLYQQLNKPIPPSKGHEYLLSELYSTGAKSKVDLSCVFLNPTTQSCEIYDVRPFICRVHGLFYTSDSDDNVEICKIIGTQKENKANMIDGTMFLKSYEDITFPKVKINGTPQCLFERLYPIFHIYAFMFSKSKYYKDILANPLWGGILTLDKETYIHNYLKRLGIN